VTLSQIAAEPIAAAFKTTLLQLPRHYARGEHASAPIQELVQRGKKSPRRRPGSGWNRQQAPRTFRTYLIGQKKIPADLKNPFSGLHIPKPKGKRARNERYNWPPSLERTLFESPLYRGCASIHRRTAPGPEIARDALFWMPLLARTMGTRENETCNALVEAVRIEDTQHGPVPYLEITQGKDSGSPRDVPFADLVLDMGFLEQRVIGRDPGEPLFPELIPQGPGQRRSAAFGDRFAYYRRQIKAYRPRVDFHSFRANVVTDLKNIGGINSAWIDELVGHESTYRRSEGERYTKRIYLPILKKLVNSITIQADFAHLRYGAERGGAGSQSRRRTRAFCRARHERDEQESTLSASSWDGPARAGILAFAPDGSPSDLSRAANACMTGLRPWPHLLSSADGSIRRT
jgi:hypothetical protein